MSFKKFVSKLKTLFLKDSESQSAGARNQKKTVLATEEQQTTNGPLTSGRDQRKDTMVPSIDLENGGNLMSCKII